MAKARLTTRKINEFWFQKTKINSDGTPTYSYHYRRKNEKSSKIIIWNTPKAKQSLAYHAISKDLRDTLTMLNEYRILAKRAAQSEGVEARADKIALKALMTFIIVTYAKCFITADGRASILNKAVVLKKSKYIQQHDAFITMRHQYCAHAGRSIFEAARMVIPFPPLKQMRKEKGVLISPITELVQTVVDKSFANDYEPLAMEVLQHVNKKFEELSTAIWQEFADLGHEAIEKLIRRCGDKPSITYNGKVRRKK